MNFIEQIASEENLENAWVKAQYYSSNFAPFHDQTEYDLYAESLQENLIILRSQLLRGNYQTGYFRHIIIPKANGESRKVYFTSAKDNVVIMAIINVLGPYFDSLFYEGSFGNRLAIGEKENKSIYLRWQDSYQEYIQRARRFLSYPEGSYYFITDIRHFYPSVKIDVLLDYLDSHLDIQTYRLLETLLGTETVTDIGDYAPIDGLPTGTALAPFLANIYLTPLDFEMKDVTLDYIRYVDDIIMVGDQKIDIAVNKFLKKLEAIGLEHNVIKTPESPIAISEPRVLLEHTQKMHYDQRFEAIRDIPTTDKQEANQIFNDVIIAAEGGNLRKIASKSAGLVVRFFERNELDNLQNVAMKLLEIGILNANTLKSILATQMRIASRLGINNRFYDYLINAKSFEKLPFLQLLPQFSNLATNGRIKEILEHWVHSQDYLVRSAIYDVIYAIELSVTEAWVSDRIANEKNPFALAKLIPCVSKLAPERIIVFIDNSIERDNSSKLIALSKLLWMREISTRVPVSEQYFDYLSTLTENEDATEVIIKAAEILIRAKKPEYIGIVSKLPLDVRFELLKAILSRINIELGKEFDFRYLLNLAEGEEIYEPILEILTSIPSISIDIEELDQAPSDVHIEGFDYSCTRNYYGHLSKPPEYTCQIIECPNGRRATIEYININRILASGKFARVQDWWDYLDRLVAKDIVQIIDKGEFRENIIYCVYEIPRDLQTLHDLNLQRDIVTEYQDPAKVIASIVRAMEITEEEGFRFDGVIPHNVVLTSSNNPCKLLNIGFGLFPPNHNCSQSHCRHFQITPELGSTAGVHTIGLSILEMLINHCPVAELDKVKSVAETEAGLAKLLEKCLTEPHMRSVLGRILQEESSWRYQTLPPIRRDIDHIISYRRNLANLNEQGLSKKAGTYTLVDYLIFRFNVMLNSPEVFDNDKSALDRTQLIIESLSKNVKYLDDNLKGIFRDAVLQAGDRSLREYAISPKKLTPQARYLFRISEAWKYLLRDTNNLIALDNPPIECFLIFWSVYDELKTHTQNACYVMNNTIGMIDISWCGDIPDDLPIVFVLKEKKDTLKSQYLVKDLKEALQVVRYIEDGSQSFLKPVTSIRTLALLLIITVFQGKTHNLTGTSLNIELHSQEKDSTIFALITLPTKLESIVSDYFALSPLYTNIERFAWSEISDLLNALRSLSNIRRLSAELIRYDDFQDQGIICTRRVIPSLAKPHFGKEWKFTTPKTLVVGSVVKAQDKRRFVQIDTVKIKGIPYIATVLSRPLIFSELMPLSDSLKHRVVNLVRANRRYVRLVNSGSFLVLGIIVFILKENSPAEAVGIASTFTGLYTAIWEALYNFIEQLLPPETSEDK